MRSLVVDPVRRRFSAPAGRTHQIPLPPPHPRRRDIRDKRAEVRSVHARHIHAADLLGIVPYLEVDFDREAPGRARGLAVEPFPRPDILHEVPSAAPAEPGFHFFNIKDAVRIHVGSKFQFKVVCRRSVKAELQVRIADVRPVDGHVRRDLRVGERRHGHRRHMSRPSGRLHSRRSDENHYQASHFYTILECHQKHLFAMSVAVFCAPRRSDGVFEIGMRTLA